MHRLSSALCLFALVVSPMAVAQLPAGVTAKSFENPPNEFRLVHYQLSRGALKDYPQWGQPPFPLPDAGRWEYCRRG